MSRAAALLVLAAACGEPGVGPPPPLPDPDRVDPAVAEAAREAWERASARPEDSAARLELAYTFDANGLHDLARDAYAQALALDPASSRALYHLARMQALLGDWEAALANFDALVAAAAGDSAVPWAPVHWRRAEILMDQHRLDEAARAYAAATEADPGDVTGTIGSARVHLQRGEHREAADLLRSVVERRPRDGWAHGLLARALGRLGEGEAAAAARARSGPSTTAWHDPWRNEAFERGAGYAEAIGRAKMHLREGRPEEAIAAARELAAQHPRNVTVQGLLTAAYVRLERYDDALALLHEAAESQPDHYRIEMNLGLVNLRRGDLGSAERHLARALELNPQYGAGYAVLGEVYVERADWEAAAAALAEAVRLDAASLEVLMRLGRARANLGDLGGAAGAFERATRAFPESPSAWAYLAFARADGGDFGGARRALAELRRLDPDHRLAEDVAARIEVLEASAVREGR